MLALRVLLVEDHAPLREQVAALLRTAGCRVEEAADGRLALALALQSLPDVLVLDLALPGLDGLAVCRALRAKAPRRVPVLMLTARAELPDKLDGFAAGADDYLVKPFEAAELLARVQALARRPELGRACCMELGPLRLDLQRHQGWRDEQPLVLAPTALAILRELMLAWPAAVSRSELTERLWGAEPPDSDALRSHVYLLRQQLDRPFATALLRSVHGVGWRLELPA